MSARIPVHAHKCKIIVPCTCAQGVGWQKCWVVTANVHNILGISSRNFSDSFVQTNNHPKGSRVPSESVARTFGQKSSGGSLRGLDHSTCYPQGGPDAAKSRNCKSATDTTPSMRPVRQVSWVSNSAACDTRVTIERDSGV